MVIDDEPLLRCPRRPFLEEPAFFNELLWSFGRYKEGHLPEDGGLRSQPYRLIELFRVIEVGNFEADQALKEKDKLLRQKGSHSVPTPAPSTNARRGGPALRRRR